jgi:DNA-binding NarL/FixJ family response regulator
MRPIQILLVDDHDLVRAGIRALLQNISNVKVVAEAGDGRTALELVSSLRPEIVFLDVSMPGLNGLEAAKLIAKQCPSARVVILSMFANEEYVACALRSGVVGYLLKNASPTELELAIKTVMQGDTYLTPVLSKKVIEEYKARLSTKLLPFERLTTRQREVLQLIAEGNTNKEIAAKLDLSVKTVEMHRTLLMKELGIHDLAGLVRYAIRTGLASAEA